jgi:NAD(P)-dependent dehydrogenase (short-subunit alcohol dehydrogenase family)
MLGLWLVASDVKLCNGRVICLSSRAHLRWNAPLDMTKVTTETASSYDGWVSFYCRSRPLFSTLMSDDCSQAAYGRSKLSNILFVKMLAKLFPLETYHITFNSLHPGLVATKLLDVSPGSCT